MNVEKLATMRTSINQSPLTATPKFINKYWVQNHKKRSEWDTSYKDKLLEYYMTRNESSRSLTPSRQLEIEAWTQTVTPKTSPRSEINRHSAPVRKSNSKRAKSSTSDSQIKLSKKKVYTSSRKHEDKFEDYKSLRSRLNDISLHYDAQRLEVHKLHGSSTNVNLWTGKVVQTTMPKCTPKMCSKEQQHETLRDNIQHHHRDICNISSRSTSNTLLNCISIDDSKGSHLYSISKGSRTDGETDSSFFNNKSDQLPTRQNSVYSKSSSISVNSSIFTNKAVSKAFDTLLNYSEVQENTLTSGLLKNDRLPISKLKFREGSENFKKRNAALREQLSSRLIKKQNHLPNIMTGPTQTFPNPHKTQNAKGCIENRGNFLRVIMNDFDNQEENTNVHV